MIPPDIESLALRCGQNCLRSGLRMAVAESCTGGLLGAALTGIPGSSAYFLGGVISYDNAVKVELLGVDMALLATHGAVSEATALAMATGVITLLNADLALSITGIAGPGGGSHEKPVGTVWIGLADAAGARARHFHFEGSRADVRIRSVAAALEWLLLAIGAEA